MDSRTVAHPLPCPDRPCGGGEGALGDRRPPEGTIRIDGADLRHLSANELRSNFGVVPKDTVLFSGTVYENLKMANAHATFKDIVLACRMAEIHDFVEKLAEGHQMTRI